MKIIKLAMSLLMLCALYACSTPKVDKQNASNQNDVVEDSSKNNVEKEIDFNTISVVLFDFDKSNLNDMEKSKVVEQSTYLKNNKSAITVEGHTDYLGTREYNLALGERRANTTKSVLVKNGVKASRIKVVSYGKDKPVDSALTDSAREQNRRTVTNIQE